MDDPQRKRGAGLMCRFHDDCIWVGTFEVFLHTDCLWLFDVSTALVAC